MTSKLYVIKLIQRRRGGRPARSKAQDLGSCLAGVHGFESHPPHVTNHGAVKITRNYIISEDIKA